MSEDTNSFDLELTEEDLKVAEPDGYSRVKVAAEDKQHLGVGETFRDFVEGNLVKAVTKKIKRTVPDGFELDEISVQFDVKGQPMGVGVAASVSAKFKKK
ncbi:hypothetical protein [uncultured Tateyamaria sp.]|uniref:hypothetical protein n=1 Tax=uncultured Tateyamaria sp. TaxID=455651 RepID=UPI0026322BFE|nr:hypothetical protein [uncultured Tateyamaria sp.]